MCNDCKLNNYRSIKISLHFFFPVSGENFVPDTQLFSGKHLAPLLPVECISLSAARLKEIEKDKRKWGKRKIKFKNPTQQQKLSKSPRTRKKEIIYAENWPQTNTSLGPKSCDSLSCGGLGSEDSLESVPAAGKCPLLLLWGRVHSPPWCCEGRHPPPHAYVICSATLQIALSSPHFPLSYRLQHNIFLDNLTVISLLCLGFCLNSVCHLLFLVSIICVQLNK